MIVRNIAKLNRSNLWTFLKSLLYQLVILALTISLCLPFMGILSDCYGEAFSNAYSYASSGIIIGGWSGFAVAMHSIVFGIINGTTALFAANAFVGVYIIFVVVLANFLLNVIRIIISESLYGYMSSLAKTNFFQSLFKHLTRAIKYSFWRTVIGIAFNIAIFAGLAGLLTLPTAAYEAMPVIVVLYLGITIALKEMLFAGIAPAMIVYNYGIRKSAMKGIRVTGKTFWNVYPYIAMTSIVFTVCSVVLSAYSLIIIIPFCVYVFSVAEMVYFFDAQGMRYYINMQQIIAPKQLEERDNIKKAKYLV